MRIVIDTNILISAIFFDGLPEKLIDLVLSDTVVAIISEDILREYEVTVQDMIQKLHAAKFHFSLATLLEHLIVVAPQSQIEICRDPDDDKFINCAVDTGCEYIVSGDKDLLVLKNYGKVQILTVREFFDKEFVSSP
ncbi:PIN domain-containing protein [Spirochaetia bacterium]|nr:PIN domain-containing protein [Spirochaetia bacterium]